MATDAPWVIWSFEHDGWWAPAERGYVASLADAGRYTEAQARQIEARANLITRNECALSLAEAERDGAPTAQPVTDDEALIGAMVEAVAQREPFHLVLNATATVQLAGLLQLALRHPQVAGHNRRTAVLVIDQARAYFADAPAILEALRQGDDPHATMSTGWEVCADELAALLQAAASPAPDWVGKCPRCGRTVLNHGDLCSTCEAAPSEED